MAFEASLEMTDGGIAKVTLTGELDGSNAADFRTTVEEAAAQNCKRLVLMLAGLDYIASAGIRVLVFARQKMGGGVEIFAISPTPQVNETIEMTGMHYSLRVLPEYDPAVVETF
jgi:anti-anti-sigma factor